MDGSSQPEATAGEFACSACPVRDCPGRADGDESRLSGWRLVLASLVLFIGPCILAIAGAAWFRGNEWWQLCGALAGLGVGMAAAMIAAKRLRPADPDDPRKTCA